MSVPRLRRALKSVATAVAASVAFSLAPVVAGAPGSVGPVGLPAAEATGTSYPDEVNGDSPWGYWRLGESSGATTGADASGNGHSLTYVSMPLGHSGAIADDANTSSAEQQNSRATVSLSTFSPSSLSVEMWFRTTVIGSDPPAAQFVASGGTDMRIGVSATTGYGYFRLRIAGVNQIVYTSYRVADGAWHHVVGTYDGSALKIYADGALGGSLSASGTPTANTGRNFVLGNATNCTGTGCTIQGDVDEVALYSRAITATEIADHHTAGGVIPVGCTATDSYSTLICRQSPVGYWRLGGASTATPATDQSSLGNHGSYRTTSTGPNMGAGGALPGSANTAMQTTANNQGMEFPYDPYGHFASPTASLEGWMKVSSMSSWTDQDAFSIGGTNGRLGITVNGTSHALGAHVRVGSTNYTFSSGMIPFNVWIHVALTYDGQDAFLFVNGMAVATLAVSGRLAPCVNCMGDVGTPYNCSGSCAPIGTFDEVAVYDYALTVNQLAVRPFWSAPAWPGELRGGWNPAVDYDPCVCVDPVVPATGTLVESSTDLALPGRGPALAFSRTYDTSVASANGPLGYGWRHAYEMKVVTDPQLSTAKDVVQENGSVAVFGSDGSGGYVAPSRVRATLTHNGNGTWTYVRRERETFDFDSGGKLTGITDRNGYTTTLAYSSGRLTTVTDPASRTLTIGYDTSGRVSSVTDSAGRVVTYGYDTAGNLSTVSGPTSATWTFGYDTAHRMTTVTDPRSNVTTNTFDTSGRVTSQEDALHHVTTFDYPSAGTTEITDPRGAVTVQHYDQNLLMEEVSASGTADETTMSWTYDPSTLGVHTVTDGLGHVWTYEYDDDGNRLSATNPLGKTETWTYNAYHQILTRTDRNGDTTTYTYDSDGNLLTTSRPLAGTSDVATVTEVYGDVLHPGDATSTVDARGETWTRTYDTYGQLASKTDPLGNTTTYTYSCSSGCYSNIGWVYTITRPRGNASGATPSDFRTTYVRDAAGRATSVTDALGGSVTSVYDANGNLTSVTDADINATTYAYDALNRVTSMTRADSTILATAYDAVGNMTSQTDGASGVTAYTYDLRRRLTSVTDPDSNVATFAYDDAGRLVTTVDQDSNTTTLAYDDANQLVGRDYSDTSTDDVTYVYDDAGQRTSMTDGSGTTTYEHDSLGRLTRVVDGGSHDVRYTYDLGGALTSLRYPNGLSVTRGYDDAGRLTSVTDWNSAQSTFAYDEDGMLVTATYPNGTSATTTHDRLDRVSGMHHDRGATSLATFGYTRATSGVLTGVTVSGSTGQTNESYAYDDLHQLTTYTTGAGTGTFGYDAADNATSLADGTTQTFGSANTLATSTANGGTTFAYDARGNRTSAATSSATTTYGYDQLNRLVSYSGATSAGYGYDGDGLRVSKTVGATTTPFVWDVHGSMPLLLDDGTTSYVYGPGGRVIEQIGPTQSVSLEGTGSVVDSAGNATSLTVTFPAAQANDQILVAVNETNGQNAATPTGYTLVGTYPAPSAGEVTVLFRKTATGGETSAAVTFNQGTTVHAKTVLAAVYSGVDPVDPIDAVADAGTGTGATSVGTSLTTASSNGMLVLVQHGLDGSTTGTWTAPTGMTQQVQDGAATVASAIADQALGAAGSTGTKTATLSVSAQLESVLVALRRAPTTYWYHQDQRGSTRLLTDPNGLVGATLAYDPYGRVASRTGPISTPLLYDGEYRDAESGMYYLRARYYDPQTAQFLTRDPAVTSTRAAYTYAANTPLNAADPMGLDPGDDKLRDEYLEWLWQQREEENRRFNEELYGTPEEQACDEAFLQFMRITGDEISRLETSIRESEYRREMAAVNSIGSWLDSVGYGITHMNEGAARIAQGAMGCLAGSAAAETVTGGGGMEVPGIGWVTSGVVAAAGCVGGAFSADQGAMPDAGGDGPYVGKHRA